MIEHYVKRVIEHTVKEGLHVTTREQVCAFLGISTGSFKHIMGVPYTDFINRVIDALPLEACTAAGVRLQPALRRKQVIACAVELSREHKYWGFSRKQVADAAGISETTLCRLITLSKLREEVVRYGIATRDKQLIAQAQAKNDKLLTA